MPWGATVVFALYGAEWIRTYYARGTFYMFVQYLWYKLVHNEREQVFGVETVLTAAAPVSASPAYTAHIFFSFKSLSCGTSLVSLKKKSGHIQSRIRWSLSYVPTVHVQFVCQQVLTVCIMHSATQGETPVKCTASIENQFSPMPLFLRAKPGISVCQYAFRSDELNIY